FGPITAKELLRRTKEQVMGGQQHQDIPFEQVVEILKPVRSLAHSPLFQVVFAWQNVPDERLELSELELRPLDAQPDVVAKFDLLLFLQEQGERITGRLEYATSLFAPSTVERYISY